MSRLTTGSLVLRGLRYHWRSHLGVFLGALLATAILVGALAVGDSVRYSLREIALARLGQVSLVLSGQSRLFRGALADQVSKDLGAPVAPVLTLRGTASFDGGGEPVRTGGVRVYGVDERFWKLGPARTPVFGGEGAVLNDRLAQRLGVRTGDEVLFRIDKPSLLSRDAPLSTVDDATVTARVPVAGVISDAEFGRFGLEANQAPPLNAFLPLALLQEQIGFKESVNTLLVGTTQPSSASPRIGGQGASSPTVDAATEALRKHWQLADASLELRDLPRRGVELRTDRVFLDAPAAQAAMRAAPNPRGILTYFVNGLRSGGKATPYSTVAAMSVPPGGQFLADDEIILNQWTADDLAAKPGDQVTITFSVIGPMRRLEERTASFRVKSIVPLAGEAADPDLMPEIPGITDVPNCRDWDPGIPIKTEKIRDKDEAYWDRYRGTPKGFISLAAGQKIWSNRFGNLTAIRYAESREPAVVEAELRSVLSPSSIGLFFLPVRAQALAASTQALDFGQLFLGFSFFLIIAALILTALLFAFGVEQRAEEVGTLLAVGFKPSGVRRLLLAEGAGVALLAGLFGALIGTAYTRAVIGGLSSVWSGAVAGSILQYHVEPATLVGGAMAGFLVALLSIWLIARKQGQASIRELLTATPESESRPRRLKRNAGLPSAAIGLGGGLALAFLGFATGKEHAAEYFFGAGSLLLIGGLGACRLYLARLEESVSRQRLTLGTLGTRNTTRRRGRSLAAIGLLAAGSFMVVAVGANRHDPAEGAAKRSSGTGGFALYGETTLPVFQDLNSEDGREAFGLDEEELQGVGILQARFREGDEASCLNLNRAQMPRLLGISPGALRERKSFTFASLAEGVAKDDPWSVLEKPIGEGVIPVIGDTNTVMWSLGKGMGDTLTVMDDRGGSVKLKIAGVLANSVLQGALVMSENAFTRHFPSQAGYQVFLVDAPVERAAEVSKSLNRGLQDVGLNLTSASERLAAFNAVENTYLSIFTVLGGLGLLLGTFGLGIIVLRNVLERRGELALLRAIGFRTGALRWLVFSEHSLLLGLGLLVGVGAAVVAVLPSLTSPGAGVPYASLIVTLSAVLAVGLAWTWAATSIAVRGELMAALRNE